MKIIIDGYNVLGVAPKHYTDHNQFRNWLVQRLALYARKKKVDLLVVFDGGPYLWPTRMQHSRLVELVFTGREQSADKYIKDYLDDHRMQDTMLVSSDREICAVAQSLNKPFIGSKHFYNLVDEALSPIQKPQESGVVIKRTAEGEHKAIDALMTEAAMMHYKDKDEPAAGSLDYSKAKLSKQDRKLLMKIKKL